jgi:hypothetical protein
VTAADPREVPLDRLAESVWVDLPRSQTAGLIEQGSLEERIRRAEHDAGMPINALGRQSHCWLCREADVNDEGANAEYYRARRKHILGGDR